MAAATAVLVAVAPVVAVAAATPVGVVEAAEAAEAADALERRVWRLRCLAGGRRLLFVVGCLRLVLAHDDKLYH